MFNLFNQFDLFRIGSNSTVAYNPLINYDWSTTTTSGLRYLKDVGSTPTYNASMYFGRGAYFNGVDQGITSIPLTLGSKSTIAVRKNANSTLNSDYLLYFTGLDLRFTGGKILYYSNASYVVLTPAIISNIIIDIDFDLMLITIYEDTINIGEIAIITGTVPTDVSIGVRGTDYGVGTLKDLFIFNRKLTQVEHTEYSINPELFYVMAQADSTCVLNMPMCETSSTARNYKTGTDYTITNYTSSVRDNAKNLQYGLQTCKFVRDSLGVIQSASDYLECAGAGYVNTGWIPKSDEDWTLEIIKVIDNTNITTAIGTGVRNTTIQNSNVMLYASGYLYTQIHVGSLYYPWYHVTSIFISSLVIVFKKIGTNIGTVEIYSNGILLTSGTATFNNGKNSFYLGCRSVDGVASNFDKVPIRLFKVHNKALTQAEITANYNSYVAKGLLS